LVKIVGFSRFCLCLKQLKNVECSKPFQGLKNN